MSPADQAAGGRPGYALCPVVGLGASAGGLDAFTRFFRAMPPDSGMAFVLVQHLDPTHESLTAELLDKQTRMPVRQVAGDTPVEANHVYVIPPNKDLSLRRGVLRLTLPVQQRAMRMPVDFFFRTLAKDRQERAIGIILSGTGTDGTLGLKEIKTVGGMALVQDPDTAQHEGMPRSAIANDAADRVLAVEQMPEALLRYAQHWYVAAAGPATGVEEAPDDLMGIVALVRTRLRFDFTGYKTGTLVRRVRRRMGLRHVERLSEYLQVLRSDPGEVKALFKDLLIGVTRFFRDPAAWHALKRTALSSLMREREAGTSLRVWVPGCGTGEEAYSLGMLLIEQAQAAPRRGPIQIFASDVDREALDVARAGLYPESIAADMPAERLRRFFLKEGNHYRVNKELRETIIFAEQSLIADPPFSRLDLISCRNLLIYLNSDVQKRVIALFHFTLTEGGYLFLGSAESIGPAEDSFETVSRRWRIYRRIGPTRHALVLPVMVSRGPVPGRQLVPRTPQRGDPLVARLQRLLLDRYAPASVVISRRYEILLFSGPIDRYLTQPTGPPTQDLLARVREGLETRLRGLVHRAIQDGRPGTVSGVRLRRDGAWYRVQASVEPLAMSPETEGLLLVSFRDEQPVSVAAAAASGDRDEPLVQQLESELKASREDLQSTIEERETSNEELRAATEEVMSVNEELQSTNEELETSKEELQSLNEELSTVNAQLQAKVEELERATSDLDNLLTSTNIATVLVDRQLCIRRYTTVATKLFTLIPSDVGRPLADITQKFTDPTLLTDAATVLDAPTTRRAEVPAQDGRWYVRQILPYQTRAGGIDGVVITFSDVAAEALHAARSRLEVAVAELTEKEAWLRAVVDTAAEAIITIDESGTVVSFNRAAEGMFGYGAAEILGKDVRMLMPPVRRKEPGASVPRHHETRLSAIAGTTREVEGLRRDGTRFPMELAVSEFTVPTGRKFTGIARDLTERRRAEQRLRLHEHQAELAHLLRLKTAGELGASLAHQLNQPLSAIANDVHTSIVRLQAGKTTTVRGLLAHAAAQIQRAAAILRRFRDLVRKSPSQLKRHDVRDVIREAEELVRPALARHRVAFEVDVPPESLPVRMDRLQIEQVVLNLVQNALEAVQAGGRRRRVRVQAIRLQATRDAPERAQITVQDGGPGLPSEVTERLFEPFFTTKKGGLGMGLAIARTIVEAHDGRIWVERRSRQGGAALSFTLPLLGAPKAKGSHDKRTHSVRHRR